MFLHTDRRQVLSTDQGTRLSLNTVGHTKSPAFFHYIRRQNLMRRVVYHATSKICKTLNTCIYTIWCISNTLRYTIRSIFIAIFQLRSRSKTSTDILPRNNETFHRIKNNPFSIPCKFRERLSNQPSLGLS